MAKSDRQMHDFADFSAALCRHEVQLCGEKLPALASHPRIIEYLHVSRHLSAPKTAIILLYIII